MPRIQNAASEFRDRSLHTRLAVELLGTFMLVATAAGPGVINEYVGGTPISRSAAVIAPGAMVMALIYAWGPLSGVHVNPLVTLAFTGRGVFPATWALPYVAAQITGAVLAALFLQLTFGHVTAGGTFPIDRTGGGWRTLVIEILLTAILVTVILNTATGYRIIGHNAAIGVGGTIALLGLFASPISGAAMNPARTFGPDIVGADFTGWWAYLLGQLVGAGIAVLITTLVCGVPGGNAHAAAQGSALPLSSGDRPSGRRSGDRRSN